MASSSDVSSRESTPGASAPRGVTSETTRMTVNEIEAGPTASKETHQPSFLHGSALTKPFVNGASNSSDEELDNARKRRQSSVSSDNGLYEPIGDPRVGTLERVVQMLNQPIEKDNVYHTIDDDVCSFYSFQSSQSSTSPTGRLNLNPHFPNIYDPVTDVSTSDAFPPGSNREHWDTLDSRRDSLRDGFGRRFVVLPGGKTAVVSTNLAPPPRPTRGIPGKDGASATKSLDAILEHRPAIQANGSHFEPQSKLTAPPLGAQAPPLKGMARSRVMAAISAPSSKISNLLSKFPRRSKSLDPSLSTRVRGQRYTFKKKSLQKQKSLDDNLMSQGVAHSHDKKKFALRLWELLRLDRLHRNLSHSADASSKLETNPQGDVIVKDLGPHGRLVATGSGECLVAHLEREIQSKQIIPPVMPLSGAGTSGVMVEVLSGSGPAIGKDENAVAVTTPSKKTPSTEAGANDSRRVVSGKKSKALSPKERPKVPPPKTPTSPINSSLNSFEFPDGLNAASQSALSSPKSLNSVNSSTGSNQGNYATNVPSTAKTKPSIPKKPQLALFANPKPPPRKSSRSPTSTSTGSSIASVSSNNSDSLHLSSKPPPSDADDFFLESTASNGVGEPFSGGQKCEDYLEPVNGGSLYSISEPLFTTTNATNHNNNSVPKPYPRRRSLKKLTHKQKLPKSTTVPEVSPLSNKSLTRSKQLQGHSFDDYLIGKQQVQTEPALTETNDSKIVKPKLVLLDVNSLSHSNGYGNEQSKHQYFTLCQEDQLGVGDDNENLLEPHQRTRAIVQRTLDKVVAKSLSLLQPIGKDTLLSQSIMDWDILSHIPFTFHNDPKERFSVYAASLKADPSKAYSLVLIPSGVVYDQDQILNFMNCHHHLPSASTPQGLQEFFLPVFGSFTVQRPSVTDLDAELNSFQYDFDGREVLISPLPLEGLQTLDSFLTEKTLRDLASEEPAASLNTARASILLQLFHIAHSFSQHCKCLNGTLSDFPNAPVFAIRFIKTLLIYTGSKGANAYPKVFLNPCDFFVGFSPSNESTDHDDDSDDATSLMRLAASILGATLNASFASVEDFMRRSSHRKPRLDAQLLKVIQRLEEDPGHEKFLGRVTWLLKLITHGPPLNDVLLQRKDENETQLLEKFWSLCDVEEAKVMSEMVQLVMDHGGTLDERMALSLGIEKAQSLIEVRRLRSNCDEMDFKLFYEMLHFD